MKLLMAFGILSMALGCTSRHTEQDVNGDTDHHGHHQGGHQHGHSPQAGTELIVATDPPDPLAGRPVTLKLMIHAADGSMVKDFGVVHEEKVHLVTVRATNAGGI